MAAKLPRSTTDSDHELIRKCREGDESAWEAMVLKYRRLVYSIPHAAGLKKEQAEDVFQAVFHALLKNIGSIRQQETLIPWLVTTARRESWKASRRAGQAVRREEDFDQVEPVAGEPLPLDDLEILERQITVRATLEAMEERCRRLLELLFYQDPPMPYGEIARELHMPAPSIGPTRIRCLEKLRKSLKGKGPF